MTLRDKLARALAQYLRDGAHPMDAADACLAVLAAEPVSDAMWAAAFDAGVKWDQDKQPFEIDMRAAITAALQSRSKP